MNQKQMKKFIENCNKYIHDCHDSYMDIISDFDDETNRIHVSLVDNELPDPEDNQKPLVVDEGFIKYVGQFQGQPMLKFTRAEDEKVWFYIEAQPELVFGLLYT